MPKDNFNLIFVIRTIMGILVLSAIFFGTAGTFDWPEAWIYMGIQFSFSIIIFTWLKKHNLKLLKDRMKFMKKTANSCDKVILIGTIPLCLVLITLPGLDAVRYQWSVVPLGIKTAAFILIILSFGLVFLVMKENSFLSRIVEIQPQRGHHVISTGPYSIVRHPMYVGVNTLFFCIPIALGSLYSLIPGILLTIVVLIRAHLEDKTLHKELAGYQEYAEKTKYRLLPGVW